MDGGDDQQQRGNNRRSSDGSAASSGSDGYSSIPSRTTSSSAASRSFAKATRKGGSMFKGGSSGGSRGLRKRKDAVKKTISPAERDLRLLSAKAAEAFTQTKFDQWLARKHLVFPYLLTIMCLCYTIPVCILVLEEMDPGFAEYGRWVWRITIFLTFGLTVPMWIAMMQWSKFPFIRNASSRPFSSTFCSFLLTFYYLLS